MSIKSFYLISRNPKTSKEEFRANWRAHAKLAGSFPSLLSKFDAVTQCLVVGSGSEGTDTPKFDGANLLEMVSLLDAVEVWVDPSTATMREDELRVFANYVRDCTLTVHETVLLDGPATPVVYLQYIRRSPSVDFEAFIRAWTGDFARKLREIPAARAALRRHIHNHVVVPPPLGFNFDGVSEMWFESAEACTALLADERYQSITEEVTAWSTPSDYAVLCLVGQTWRKSATEEAGV